MAQARKKAKPTSLEDPKFEKKRQSDKNAAIRAGTSKNTGRDAETQRTVNESAKKDRGMPVKHKGGLLHPIGSIRNAGSYYAKGLRKGVAKFLGKGPSGRRKKKTNETLGSLANPGK